MEQQNTVGSKTEPQTTLDGAAKQSDLGYEIETQKYLPERKCEIHLISQLSKRNDD